MFRKVDLRLVCGIGFVGVILIFLLSYSLLYSQVEYSSKIRCNYPNYRFEIYEYSKLSSYQPIVIDFIDGTQTIVSSLATCTITSMSPE